MQASSSIPSSSPHPLDVHLGQRLRLQRNHLGLSQKAVGDSIGVTYQQIQKYESGMNRISAVQLHEIARMLKVAISYFFEGFQSTVGEGSALSGFAESASAEFDAFSYAGNKESLELLRIFQKISDPVLRKRFLELGRALADQSSPASGVAESDDAQEEGAASTKE